SGFWYRLAPDPDARHATADPQPIGGVGRRIIGLDQALAWDRVCQCRHALTIPQEAQGLQNGDAARRANALPWQALHQRLQLFLIQHQAIAPPRIGPMELTLIESAGTEPDAEAIVNEHFHAVASPVGEQISAVRLGGAEH